MFLKQCKGKSTEKEASTLVLLCPPSRRRGPRSCTPVPTPVFLKQESLPVSTVTMTRGLFSMEHPFLPFFYETKKLVEVLLIGGTILSIWEIEHDKPVGWLSWRRIEIHMRVRLGKSYESRGSLNGSAW